MTGLSWWDLSGRCLLILLQFIWAKPRFLVYIQLMTRIILPRGSIARVLLKAFLQRKAASLMRVQQRGNVLRFQLPISHGTTSLPSSYFNRPLLHRRMPPRRTRVLSRFCGQYIYTHRKCEKSRLGIIHFCHESGTIKLNTAMTDVIPKLVAQFVRL